MMKSSLVLRHQPYGELHPYIPLPYERSPRDPASGEPVTLFIETEHNPSASAVWCEWSEDGKPLVNRMDAVLLSKGEEFDHWQVSLPAFDGGETIRYRFFAKNGNEQTRSEEFEFCVSSWIKVNSVKSITEVNDRLQLELKTDLAGLFIHLVIEPDEFNTLSIKMNASNSHASEVKSKTGSFTKAWGDLQLSIQTHPCNLVFQRKIDNLVLKNSEPVQVLVDGNGKVLQYRLCFDSPADEAFYGFGERFNALNQRGNHLDNYVYGQYTNQGKRTYIPIPFFVSSRGYGLWLKTNRQAQFDLAAEKPDSWWITGNAEDDSSLELKCFFQTQPYEIVKAFTELTGKPKMPANWVFGLWMSSNDWNSQAEVLKQLHETQKQQIPASVLVIEAWSDEINFYIWNDAQYQIKPSSEPCRLSDFTFASDSRWPNLKAMVDELHKNDVRLVLWQNPTIKFALGHESFDTTLNQADQEYAIEHGYVVKKADGTPHRVEKHMPWFGNSLVFDFTNPEAADWWFSKREYIVTELGVDGWKSDGGEHIWDPETRFFNGTRGATSINQYPVDYEAAYDRFMTKLRGNDFVLFSRAGYTGSQCIPCHWAGDENSTWDAFRATLRALLNVGVSGLPFVGWDIAGFAGPIPTSELYLRATAFSVFCPIMQYHSDVNHTERTSRDRTPWNMQKQTGDTKIVPMFRQFANLRMNLLPYILNQARLSSRSGLPLMRSMELVYPQDLLCRKYATQYFFGEALLVAPVVEEGVNELTLYLPEGEWRDFWTGKIYQGPIEMKVTVPFDRIPVYQKKGSILPLNLDHSGELCSAVGNSTTEYNDLTLQIFAGDKFMSQIALTPDSDSEVIVVESTNNGSVLITLSALPGDLFINLSGNQPQSVAVDGKALRQLSNTEDLHSNAGWKWDAQMGETKIHLSPSAQPTKVVVQ